MPFALRVDKASAIGFPVIDIANLVQAVISAVNMVQSVVNQVTQIQNQAEQITNQAKNLAKLDVRLFTNINQLAIDSGDAFDNLVNNVQGIGYQLNNIQQEVENTFGDIQNWGQVRLDQYNNNFRQWNNQLMDSAMDAMRSQTIVTTIQRAHQEMKSILRGKRTSRR